MSAMGEGNRPAGSGRTTVFAAAVGVPVPHAETKRISGARATLNISRRTWPRVSAARPMQGSGREAPAILCARAAGGEANGDEWIGEGARAPGALGAAGDRSAGRGLQLRERYCSIYDDQPRR